MAPEMRCLQKSCAVCMGPISEHMCNVIRQEVAQAKKDVAAKDQAVGGCMRFCAAEEVHSYTTLNRWQTPLQKSACESVEAGSNCAAAHLRPPNLKLTRRMYRI